MGFLTRTLPVDLPYVILTLLTVLVRVPSMEDLSNDATARTAPVRKAACCAVGPANARLGQLWLDALAAERGAAARTLKPLATTSPRPHFGRQQTLHLDRRGPSLTQSGREA
jgi:hypothetical protein